MKVKLRSLLAVLFVLLLAGCASTGAAVAPPRLLVFIAVDGLPQRQVTAYRDQLAPDGFARFLRNGAWFSEAHYGHAFTVTAAGHATMLTGAYPHRTGIIGNDWLDPGTGQPVYNTGDAAYRYIDNPTEPLDGTSPRNLRVETLGDVLKRVDARSKVITVSGKDRGAILLAGHAGQAYMYGDDTGRIVSSTYYMASHPAWVERFNAAKPADRYFKATWTPLLPDQAYAASLPDAQPWFMVRGARLPMMMGAPADDAPGRVFYRQLLTSPFIDALALEFARAAIAGEALGQDGAPDILGISLSGHDYVNHAFSAESRLSHDHFLQLDRLLQAFFRDLDATVGAGNYLAVLTADHGFMPAPEVSRAQGRDAARFSGGDLVRRVAAGLAQRFGPGEWLRGFSAGGLLINRRTVADQGLALDAVADAARELLLAHPAVAAAYTRSEIVSGSRAGAPYFDAVRKTWFAQRSADVQWVPKAYWMAANAGTTHGSPYPYDTHVPILMWGPAWVKPGRVDDRVEPVDIAPTLARILRVPAPAASEGKPLPLP